MTSFRAVGGGHPGEFAAGDAGNDSIAGFGQSYGGDANDVVNLNRTGGFCSGDAGDDSIYGGDGHDTLHGSDGRDRVHGKIANDSVNGGGGADMLYGGSGDDTVFGAGGNDRIFGGDGVDALKGGFGRDWFVFKTVVDTGLNETEDIILDFNRLGRDKIDLHAIAPGLHFMTTEFSGTAGEVRFNAVTTTIEIDLDGVGGADGSIRLMTVGFGPDDLILA